MASRREFGVSESSAGEATSLDQFNIYNRDLLHKVVSFPFCDLYRNTIWNLYLLNPSIYIRSTRAGSVPKLCLQLLLPRYCPGV